MEDDSTVHREDDADIHLSSDFSHKSTSFPGKTNGLFVKVVRLAMLLWAMGLVTYVTVTQPVVAAPLILALRPLLEYFLHH